MYLRVEFSLHPGFCVLKLHNPFYCHQSVYYIFWPATLSDVSFTIHSSPAHCEILADSLMHSQSQQKQPPCLNGSKRPCLNDSKRPCSNDSKKPCMNGSKRPCLNGSNRPCLNDSMRQNAQNCLCSASDRELHQLSLTLPSHFQSLPYHYWPKERWAGPWIPPASQNARFFLFSNTVFVQTFAFSAYPPEGSVTILSLVPEMVSLFIIQ